MNVLTKPNEAADNFRRKELKKQLFKNFDFETLIIVLIDFFPNDHIKVRKKVKKSMCLLGLRRYY
jgi:hypothetical protein